MSAEPKFTPGPWRIAGKGTIRAGTSNWIASINWFNRKANAHLIAAAPDLFRCAEILAGLESDDGGRAFPTKQDCQFARATLSKANPQFATPLSPQDTASANLSPATDTMPRAKLPGSPISGDA